MERLSQRRLDPQYLSLAIGVNQPNHDHIFFCRQHTLMKPSKQLFLGQGGTPARLLHSRLFVKTKPGDYKMDQDETLLL